MKEELRYNWLDILRAPKMALSFQKLWILFLPMITGYVIYLAMTFIGLGISGECKAGFQKYGLMLFPVFHLLNVGGIICWVIGLAVLLVAVLFGCTAVARATFLELKGETFFTSKELFGFARKNLKNTILGPLGIFIMIISIAFGALLVGWIGLIPYVGILFTVGFTPFWFPVAIFLVLLTIIFILMVIFAPPIIASTKGDFFEVITETIAMVFTQPFKLTGYLLLIYAVMNVCVSIMVWIVCSGYEVMLCLLNTSMGDAFKGLSAKTGQVLADLFPYAESLTPKMGFGLKIGSLPEVVTPVRMLGNFKGVHPTGMEDPGTWLTIWAYFLAIVAASAGFLVIVCFSSAIISCGSTLAYLVLYKQKNEEDLLDMEDDEAEAEEEEEAAGAEEAEGTAEAEEPEKAEETDKAEEKEEAPSDDAASDDEAETEPEPDEAAKKDEAEDSEAEDNQASDSQEEDDNQENDENKSDSK